MADDKRVQCVSCEGVAFVRRNRVGDPFLTCPRCGAWNGRGAAYRAWCESLPALPELSAQRPAEPTPAPEPETVPEPEPTVVADNWLADWGAS